MSVLTEIPDLKAVIRFAGSREIPAFARDIKGEHETVKIL